MDRLLKRTPQQILRDEFTLRCNSNPRYSIRSFARFLDVSHSSISLFMAGKRSFSKETAKKIATKLNLSPVETQILMKKNDPFLSSQASSNEEVDIDLETFSMISDWVHFAILSLLEIKDSKFDSTWLAKRLNIEKAQAQVAMERLIKLNLVKEVRGRTKQTGSPIRLDNKVSTKATKNFQKQLLEKSLHSLETDPLDVRNHSSITMAIDPKSIPHAVERIKDFRRELFKELESFGTPSEVYNLSVQLFPLTKIKK